MKLDATGWASFAHEKALESWADHALVAAIIAADDPANAKWWRSGGTWFVGVNCLPNSENGAISASGLLPGHAAQFAARLDATHHGWDRAQVSIIRPGYPQRGDDSDAAFAYRQNRDAAHVDGLKRAGPANRRFLDESHAFVLGIPLTETDPSASPLVIWQGSHNIIRAAFTAALAGVAPPEWRDVDLTDAYHAARRHCFKTCERIPIHARPGQAYVIHRLALHGIAPWQTGAQAPPVGRVIAYFRPPLADIATWLA